MTTPIHSPINLGNPNEISILELSRLIIEITGSKSEIIYKPLPEDDPRQRRPDISKAKEILGWQPKIQLREGLEKTVYYFKTVI
jgi:nucleoside-diphosphate-sugar epimerase